MLLCSTHDKDWNVKEEIHGWDVDDVTVTTLIATYEQAKACLQTIEVTDSSHKAELNF